MVKTYSVCSLDKKPVIRITGKWLEENDIHIGDKLELFNDNGMLVLIKMSEEEIKNQNKLKQLKRLEKQITVLKQN